MGREIRMVPPNWEHPKNNRGHLQPMHDKNYADACKLWLSDLAEHKPEEHGGLMFWDYDRRPPEREYHRPWKDAEATWFQVWETVTEGTPVSPPFATREELVNYLAGHGDFWDEGRGWGHKRAEAFVNSGWAPSGMIMGGQFMTGIEAIEILETLKGKEDRG